ncbi:hypothetical protein [Sphingomonas sp. TDK1]|uniref:hypothetical protein n=1 Tax=Sphingomonas sp. TDK1 TaxID=453247 RepID=UPI0007D9530A|nr:hypothetical protein [Sphingomonas sp. TDK1]OAN65664.1 hypothetical protein A7X12_15190 [Sphingomonas sp. TDK1]
MSVAVDPVIVHLRDRIRDESGAVTQDYNYLVYDFGDDRIARTYLDTSQRVAVMRQGPVPEAMLAYLRARFDVIDQLGPTGYQTIWTA